MSLSSLSCAFCLTTARGQGGAVAGIDGMALIKNAGAPPGAGES